jgi:hypothetical protein
MSRLADATATYAEREKEVRSATPCDAISCCALYVVQRNVMIFRVAPERVHKFHYHCAM